MTEQPTEIERLRATMSDTEHKITAVLVVPADIGWSTAQPTAHLRWKAGFLEQAWIVTVYAPVSPGGTRAPQEQREEWRKVPEVPADAE